MQTSKENREIVIVGAGVIGLTCGYQLALKGYKNVIIISKDFPTTGLRKAEYTSSKSGAHFRPFPSRNSDQYRDSRYTRSTYNYFKRLAVEHPESSVKFMKGIDYLEYPDPLYMKLGKGYHEGVDDFKVIPKKKLPRNVVFGATYKTWCMNSPVYLEFLQNELDMKYGYKFIFKNVPSLSIIAETYPHALIINATGMGLQYDGSYDPSCYQIRGQTLLVRPPLNNKYERCTVTYQMANGEWSFVIPRPLSGGVIIGGTKVVNGKNPNPDPVETKNLIENAKKRFPELLLGSKNEFEIRRVNVGFRPARRGGAKVKKSVVAGTTIIDCYGFAGSGMEMSWGAAEKVVSLLENDEAFQRSKL